MVKAEYNTDVWEERLKHKTIEYHNSLMDLFHKKMENKDNEELSFADYDEVMQTFASCISIQRTMIVFSMDEAEKALTDAFIKCGFVVEDGIASEKKDG